MNFREIKEKFVRNVKDATSLGLFFYKIRFKINLFYWKYFTKSAKSRISTDIKAKMDADSFVRAFDFLDIMYDISLKEKLKQEEVAAIIAEADKSMINIFDLLGSGPSVLDPLDWHTDFKCGYKWQKGVFYMDYTQESISSDSDVKVPRELSRAHHFLKLGLAYRLTGDSKYAQKIVDQIDHWIEENPLMFSINWGCAMDVAIRAVNWIWALHLIREFWSTDERFSKRVKISLYEHGWFIFRNPEKATYNNHNHYLADLAGQIHLGLLFYGTPEGKKWLETGMHELYREIRTQILPSGMSYERSTNYNRLVLEIILAPLLLMKKNGIEIPQDIWYRLESMFDFIAYTLKPDGTSPVVGDQDNGRLLPFGTEALLEYNYLLALGSTLFRKPYIKPYTPGFNIYCLMLGGKTAYETFQGATADSKNLISKGFPDVGLYIFRNNNNYLFYNCMGKGLYPEINKFGGTHTHSDALSFELVMDGKTFLVDPGSYVYTANADERMKFRSTSMHNTVVVDNKSQDNLEREKLWGYERNAIPRVSNWETDSMHDIIKSCHTGYERLDNPVTHIREIKFDKEKDIFTINDKFEGIGYHIYDWYFHFDIDIDFDISGNKIVTKCKDGSNIVLDFESEEILKFDKISSYVSKSYGAKCPSLCLKVNYSGINLPLVKIIIYSTQNKFKL